MATVKSHIPRLAPQVTVSSTFTDLVKHRAALIKSIKAHGLTDVAMENDAAKLTDVIESSIQMVRDGSAYIGIISLKYGQTPGCPRRNPDGLSITELEFNEAVSLGRPILLFIMGPKHRGEESDFEHDPSLKAKLDSFRERAKKMSPDSGVHRVYAVFNSLSGFKDKIGPSVAELRRSLDAKSTSTGAARDTQATEASCTSLLGAESAAVLQEGIEWMHDYVNRALKILLSNTPIPSPNECGVTASANELSMKFSRTELIIRFGRIEECEDKLPGYAVALPSTEFFDDDCAIDPNSALGAYFKSAFPKRIARVQKAVTEELKNAAGVLVEREGGRMHRSYGVAKCVYLENLFGSRRRMILVAVTTKRAKVGLRCEPFYLFAAMKALCQTMNDYRLWNLSLPAMGSGHGGVEPELALLYLILSLKAVIDRRHSGAVKTVTIVVFQKDQAAKPSIAKDVVSRIMSIARVVP